MQEPMALIYSLEKLQRGYALLSAHGLTSDEIGRLYVRAPRLLGMNLGTPLQTAKIEFFHSVLEV